MKTEDFDSFCEVVVGMAELKGKQLSSVAIQLYFNSLRHWPIDEFRRAAEHLLRDLTWMPQPSDFERLRHAGEPTAGEAWEIVLSGQPLQEGSRIERAARICGGQSAIRRANVERDLQFIQRRYMDAYGELQDVDKVRDALPRIAASSQRRARLKGPEPLNAALPNLCGESSP
jgi:hypothetical protein